MPPNGGIFFTCPKGNRNHDIRVARSDTNATWQIFFHKLGAAHFTPVLHNTFVLDGTVCPSLRGLTVGYSGITHAATTVSSKTHRPCHQDSNIANAYADYPEFRLIVIRGISR